jgi:hypothetical protein
MVEGVNSWMKGNALDPPVTPGHARDVSNALMYVSSNMNQTVQVQEPNDYGINKDNEEKKTPMDTPETTDKPDDTPVVTKTQGDTLKSDGTMSHAE